MSGLMSMRIVALALTSHHFRQWCPEVSKRYRSRKAKALVAIMTTRTIQADARLGAGGPRLRFMAALLVEINLTAGGPRPCVIVPCDFPEVTCGWAISAARQHRMGFRVRHRGRASGSFVPVNMPECGPVPQDQQVTTEDE